MSDEPARTWQAQVARWKGLAELLAAFEAIGRDGAVAIVKVDGERTNGDVYTVVVSGAKLGGRFFRKDGGELAALLQEALAWYADAIV